MSNPTATVVSPPASGPASEGGAPNLFTAAPAAPPAQPGSAPAVEPHKFINPDGSFVDGWYTHFADLKDHGPFKPMKHLEDLAKSYAHTKGMVGTKLEMPGEGATPEQVAAWRKTVGAPDTVDGYGDLRPQDFPVEAWSKEGEQALKAIAHKHHMSQAALKEVIALHQKEIQASAAKYQEGEQAALREGEQRLRREWGGDYEGNLRNAGHFATLLGLDPKANPIFADPDVVLAMARGAKLLMEGKAIQGAPADMASTISDRINDITSPQSASRIAREYRGEFGEAAQQAAQKQLHSLLDSMKQNRR